MFLRRVATSAFIVVVLALIGFWGNSVVMTHDRTELAYNSRNLVRLHILANSDRPVDQSIKTRVRDAILVETRRLFLNVRDPEQAMRLAKSRRKELSALAGRVIEAAGGDYGARVEVGVFPFAARSYPFGTLPAGQYQAVKVVLGRGEGRNWWCVLFPPLCFMTPATAKPAGPVHLRLIFLEHLLEGNKQAFDSFWRGWARFWGLTEEA